VQAALIPGRRTALWLALAAVILPSPALELGPAEVQSALGEKLDARIPLRAREGEWFHAKCLELTREAIPGVAPLTDGVLSVERRRTSTNLRIRSADVVNDPALGFAITSHCTGAPQPLGPPVMLLIDPPRVDRAGRQATPVAQAPQQASPRRERVQAAPPPPAAAAPPRPIEPTPTKAVQAAPSRPAPVTPAAAPTSRARPGDFVLRLSSEPMDMARAPVLDDKSRSRLRERLRLLDSDDQVAEMLSMRDNMRRLEARVAELQLKLAVAPPAFPAAAPGEAAKPATPVPTPESTKPAAPSEPPKRVAAPEAQQQPQPAPAKERPSVAAAAPQAAAGEESIVDALQSFKGRLIGAAIAILILLV
jgi:hypothetical protein